MKNLLIFSVDRNRLHIRIQMSMRRIRRHESTSVRQIYQQNLIIHEYYFTYRVETDHVALLFFRSICSAEINWHFLNIFKSDIYFIMCLPLSKKCVFIKDLPLNVDIMVNLDSLYVKEPKQSYLKVDFMLHAFCDLHWYCRVSPLKQTIGNENEYNK